MLNKPVPDFELPATGGRTFQLSRQTGKKIVLYFYPKDATPGCTMEGQQFRDLYPEFQETGCVVCGISRDSMKSHDSFKARHNFPFDLLSDSEEVACTLFGVIKMKNMYGKQVRGIERSTFFIDADGILRQEWRGVRADGHAQGVLDFVRMS